MHRQPGKEFDPDKWEFVSALVKDDSNLQEYAAKQVLYETGLNVEFVKAGNDFKVYDEYGERLIHPFLFEAASDNVVLRQKDHSEYQWTLTSDLKLYRTVKDLDKSLLALDFST